MYRDDLSYVKDPTIFSGKTFPKKLEFEIAKKILKWITPETQYIKNVIKHYKKQIKWQQFLQLFSIFISIGIGVVIALWFTHIIGSFGGLSQDNGDWSAGSIILISSISLFVTLLLFIFLNFIVTMISFISYGKHIQNLKYLTLSHFNNVLYNAFWNGKIGYSNFKQFNTYKAKDYTFGHRFVAISSYRKELFPVERRFLFFRKQLPHLSLLYYLAYAIENKIELPDDNRLFEFNDWISKDNFYLLKNDCIAARDKIIERINKTK